LVTRKGQSGNHEDISRLDDSSTYDKLQESGYSRLVGTSELVTYHGAWFRGKKKVPTIISSRFNEEKLECIRQYCDNTRSGEVGKESDVEVG
jgi:hypothetical protein